MLEGDHLSGGFAAGLALRDATLTLARGERLGVAGESGSGKTMLGLAALGMLPAAARVTGSVRFDGQELVGAAEHDLRRLRGQRIAMVFQEPLSALNPLRRVGDLIAEPLRLHRGLSRAAATDRAAALLDEVGLPDPVARLRQYPHEMSGGQRQRVTIALALACDPDLLIADEPTTALDVQVAAHVLDLLRDLSERRRMALILISHDLRAIARVTDRLAILYGGDIVEQGATVDVLAQPRHPYTQGLIAARPVLSASRDRHQPLPTIPGNVPALADLPPGCRFAGRCPVELPVCRATRPTGNPACHHEGA